MTTAISIAPMRAGEQAAWATMRSRLWPDCTPDDNAEDLAQLRDQRGALKIVFLAHAEGKPAGFAEISERSVVDSAGPDPSAYLEGWYVEPEWRGKGVGGAMVQAAADWARKNGYRFLGSDVEFDNIKSQRAHEALGFRETGRVVRYLMALTP